jgi:hypothetical protein
MKITEKQLNQLVKEVLQLVNEQAFQPQPGSEKKDPDLERLGRDMGTAASLGGSKDLKAAKLNTANALEAVGALLSGLRGLGVGTGFERSGALALDGAEMTKVLADLKAGYNALRKVSSMLNRPGQDPAAEGERDDFSTHQLSKVSRMEENYSRHRKLVQKLIKEEAEIYADELLMETT